MTRFLSYCGWDKRVFDFFLWCRSGCPPFLPSLILSSLTTALLLGLSSASSINVGIECFHVLQLLPGS